MNELNILKKEYIDSNRKSRVSKKTNKRKINLAIPRLNWHSRFMMLSAVSGKLIYVYDIGSGVINWDGDTKRVFGYSEKEMAGGFDSWKASIHPEDCKRVLDSLEKCKNKCSVFNVRYRFKNKKNKYIVVADAGFFIPDEKGKAVQMVGIVSDVTFETEQEELIKKSEKEFLSVVNETPFFIYRINLKGEIIFANNAYCKTFGMSPSEIIGKTAYDIHPKVMADKYFADDKKVFKTNKTFYTIEENVVKATGNKEKVEVFKIPLHNEKGKVVGLQGVYWNITKRIAEQKKIKKIESSYREIFDNTGEAIFIHDTVNGKIIDVNKTATQMFGYSKEELLKLTIHDISQGVAAYNSIAAMRHIEKARAKGIHGFEWKSKKKSGEVFWVEVSLRKTTIGGKGRVLAVVRDISKRKEDEKTLLLSQISINSSKDAIIWFNKSGRILYVNNAAVGLFGYTKKIIYSLSMAEIEKDMDAKLWQKRIDLLNKNGSLLLETFYINKTGHALPVEISFNYYKYENEEFIFAAVRNTLERKQSENKLKASEKRFRDMTELLPQGIFECDLKGRVTYGNKKILEMLQYSIKEMEAGFHIFDSVVNEDKHNARENLKTILEGKYKHPHEYTMVRKDGSTFPASIYSSVIFEEGVPRGLRGIIVDLSEKKAVEKEKMERDQLFALLFEKAGDANTLISGDAFVDCNETMITVFRGESREEILNKHPWELSPEYQPDGELSLIKASRNMETAYKKGSYRFEWIHQRLDGTTFPAEVVLTAIPIKGKWYLNASVRDITDKIIAEQKEKIYYQRLEKLLEIERKIISAQSTKEIAQAALKHLRVILECDRASVVLFNKENGSFTVIAVDSSIPTELNVGTTYKLEEGFISEMKEGEIQVFNDLSNLANSTEIDKVLMAKGIRSRLNVPLVIDKKVLGSLNLGSAKVDNFTEENITLAQDVSVSISLALQHSSFIEQINRQNMELERKIDERTGQLTQTISELESFSYSVSHDLRAPLRSIGGFSQAIVDDYSDKLDEDGKNLLKRIIDASQRMSDLIDALLMLARITRSDMMVDDVDISGIVTAVANEFLRHFPERKNVKFIIQPGLFLKGDHKLMRIVIENLLNNSWKFTQKKEKTIIEFGQIEKNGVKIFFIKDNGVGFDVNYSNKLFGAFQRLHNKDEYEGTGIGLATTKRIILRHNGTIWAESKLGEDAAFYFTIGT